jgi:hypothetical protein
LPSQTASLLRGFPKILHYRLPIQKILAASIGNVWRKSGKMKITEKIANQ